MQENVLCLVLLYVGLQNNSVVIKPVSTEAEAYGVGGDVKHCSLTHSLRPRVWCQGQGFVEL